MARQLSAREAVLRWHRYVLSLAISASCAWCILVVQRVYSQEQAIAPVPAVHDRGPSDAAMERAAPRAAETSRQAKRA